MVKLVDGARPRVGPLPNRIGRRYNAPLPDGGQRLRDADEVCKMSDLIIESDEKVFFCVVWWHEGQECGCAFIIDNYIDRLAMI